MRRIPVVLSMAALILTALAVCPADAQPPVARPQPPPPAPTAKTPAAKAPVKPGTTAAPAPGAPQQPATRPQAAPASAAAAPVQASDAEAPPAPAQLNAPVLPGAHFLGSYDAGMGQRFYLYGSGQSFADVVTYYRTVLKDRGELVFDEPATHTFDVGKFKDTEVAFPPGVTVKDYTWGGSPGYMNPRLGGTPAFFPTVIQIVPPPPALAGRRD